MISRRAMTTLLLTLPLAAAAADKKTVEIAVTGITGPACEFRAQLSLNDLPGVEEVEIERDEKRATVVYEAGATPDVEAIKQAITNAGFTPGKATVSTKN